MSIKELAGHAWALELDSELDAPLRLTFRDGAVFENGMQLGSYADGPDGIRATIGEDVVLMIGQEDDGCRPVRMTTKRPGEPDLVETARLVRDRLSN